MDALATTKIYISEFDTEHHTLPKQRALAPAEYLAFVTDHKEGKRTGSMFSPVDYKPNGTRGNEGVANRWAYAFDIEQSKRTGETPPSPATVAQRMRDLGWTGAVVTTARHTPDLPRYRVHVLISDPISIVTATEQAHDKATQWGLLKMLGLEGVIDSATMDVARGYFKPRHPKGAEHYSVVINGLPLDAATLVQARQDGAELAAQSSPALDMDGDEEAAQEPPQPQETANEEKGTKPAKTASKPAANAEIYLADVAPSRRQPSPDDQVIEAFNRARSVEEMLTLHGYVRGPRCSVEGKPASRWHAPFQTTDTWGLTVIGDYWVGMSGSFHAENLGHPTPRGFRRGDAFELYCYHEHGGNFAQAVRAAAASLGIERDPFGGVDVEGSVASILAKAKAKDGTGSSSANESEMSEELEQALDDELLAAMAPEIDPTAYYGILAVTAAVTTANSEATAVGVASHLLASVSALLSPFRVELGDDRLGLNLFVSLVGPSAKARKGTSNAPTDLFILPAIHDHLRRYGGAVSMGAQARQMSQALIQSKQAKVDALRNRINFIKALTASEISERSTMANEEKKKITALEARLAEWRTKMEGSLSPSTLKDYEKSVAKTEATLISLRASLATLLAGIEADEDAIKDKATACNAVRAEIMGIEAEIQKEQKAASLIKPAMPWQELLRELSDSMPSRISGVASGEGIIWSVRDPSEGGSSGEPDPGVEEKRFLIALSEMGSLLTLASRPGNTLSAVVRNVFDCQPLATTAKVSPCSCEEPFGAISGSVTPQELVKLLFSEKDSNAQADNGFGNRFAFLFTKRNKLVAQPVKSVGLDKFGQTIANNIIKVYGALQPEGRHLTTAIGMTPAAHALWDTLYPQVEAWEPASHNASRLYGRMSTNVRKLAAVISVVNGEHEVTEGALLAAVAWMRHAANTVNFIASTLGERHQMRKVMDLGSWIVEQVLAGGTKGVTVRDLARSKGCSVTELRSALAAVLKMAPCPVRVKEEKGRGGRRVTIYPA